MRARCPRRSIALANLAGSLLYACFLAQGDAARAQDAAAETNTPVQDQRSTVVFVRPSSFGWDASTSIFEVVDGQPALKGILQGETRLEVRVAAGPHTFMVLCKGNDPEFISAKLAAGKAYFVTVALKRRFAGPASCHLEAVRDARGRAKKTDEWIAKLEPVEMNAEAARWEADNAPSIRERFVASYTPWMERHQSELPMLSEGDGR